MWTMRWLLIAMAFLPCALHAIVHTGAQNPLTEGWRVTSGDSGVGGAGIAPDADFAGIHAWQINSNASGRLRYEIGGPLESDSWVYAARLRVSSLNDAVDAGLLMEVANGARRFLLAFGSDAGGATLIDVVGDDFPDAVDLTIPPSQNGRTDYVHVALAYVAAAGTADLFINGQLLASGYTGFDGTLRRVNFGDGSSSAVGVGRFARVEFSATAPRCDDGLDNDGDGVTDFSGGDGDCLSSADPTEGTYCPVGQDVDSDGICEQIFIAHHQDTNPALEGWQPPAAAGGQAWQPGDQDIGADNCEQPCAFWRITDNGTSSGHLGTYTVGPFPHDVPGGWEYRASVRIQPFTTGVAEAVNYSKTMYARFNVSGGTREFGGLFGVDTAGNMLLQPSGGTGSISIGSTYSYHDVRFVYDPQTQTADIVVDGAVLVEDSTGRFISGFSEWAAHIGSGSSGGRGRTHWHSVALELNPDTDDDGLSNLAENTAGTDPYTPDTDGDGLSDPAELQAGTDPLDPDSDGDSLLDGYEVAGGLDPNTADADDDLDDDGLTNLEEQEVGTLPRDADSDDDGLADGLEVLTLETDPLSTDSDGDGLADDEEINTHGTNPALADSDGDAVNDGDELAAGTNPLNPDSDNDGLEDGIEHSAGTLPLIADTDGDGLDDGFETDNGFDPLTPGEAGQDGDGDGLDNLAEQTAGTSPASPDTDGDGLTDGEEVLTHGTDPTRDDTDGDGLVDTFELAGGFDPNRGGDDLADADNDGLSNLEEQQLGLNPRDADSDDDGYLDGEEIHIFGSIPQLPNPPGLPLARSVRLEFEATDQPLFDDLPDPTFVDLAPLIADQTGGTVRQGQVATINRSPSTLTSQDIWDEGVAICDAQSFNIPVHSHIKACRSFNVSPTRNECINGGNVSYASRSVGCCADVIFGIPDPTDDINNGCAFGNSEQSFTINDLNALPGGPYVTPTFVNVGSGFEPRPQTGTPLPPRPYQVGAEVTQTTQVTGGLTITPGLSSVDPGDVDLYYDTNATIRADRSVVSPGQIVTLMLDHAPLPFSGGRFNGTESNCTAQQASSTGSCLSSRWPNFLTGLDLDVTIDVSVDAEIWSIDPENGEQLHITRSLFDENLGRSYELAALDWKIGDSLDMRLLNNVPTVPTFIQQDISITNADTQFNLWSPGTKLPIPIDVPFACILEKIHPSLCARLGMPKTLKFGTNLMTFQLQIPELNSPVSQTDPSNAVSRGFNGGAPAAFSGEEVVPLRHYLNESGQLVNTVPNKFRPALNLTQLDGSAESLIDAFIFSNTDLSSDVFRYELDLDGIVCINTGGAGCLGRTVGIPLVANITADAIDLDLVLWTGWDSTMTFDPNLQASLTFSQSVMVRTDPGSAFEAVTAGQPYLVDVPSSGEGLQNVQIIQPDGGVDIGVTYTFDGNTFTSSSHYAVKLAAQASYLQAEIGGALGAIYEGAVGVPWRIGLLNAITEAPPIPAQTLDGLFTMNGSQMAFPGPSLTLIDAGTDSDGDRLQDDLENVYCTVVDDADTDDDGLPDGIEDSNRNGQVDPGETDPCLADSDGDGLQDGAERGLVTPHADTSLASFEPNPTPIVRTDPNNPDTDGDGFSDGDEFSEGADPLDPDDCPPSMCGSSILRLIPLLRRIQEE